MEEKAEKFWKDEKEKGVVQVSATPPQGKVNIDGEKIRNGLGKLILTVVELLRELMEKQAIRRIEAGALTDEEVERLGVTFMNMKKEVDKLKSYFDVEDEDLQLALGPITLRDDNSGWEGKASAVEILDRLLGTGVVVRGDILVSVAEVDLISVNLGLLLASIDKARELYSTPDSSALREQIKRLEEENRLLRKL